MNKFRWNDDLVLFMMPIDDEPSEKSCGCCDEIDAVDTETDFDKSLQYLAFFDCVDDKNCGVGSEGFEQGNECGAGGGGGSSDKPSKPSASKPTAGKPPKEGMVAPKPHSVALPTNPRRITEDQFDSGLSGMGYTRVGSRVENPNSRTDRRQFYTVRDSSGKETEIEMQDALTSMYANSSDPKLAAIKPPKRRAKHVLSSRLWEKAIEADEIEHPLSRIMHKASKKDAEREFEKVTKQEAAIGNAIGKILDRQVNAVLKKVKAASTPTAELVAEVETLLASKRWNKDVVAALRPYLEDSLIAGIAIGKETLKKLKAIPATFERNTDDLRAYAKSESVRLSNRAAESANQYTIVKFSKIIGDGVANGETIPEIAERVQAWAVKEKDEERSTTRRALTIARTEAQRASRRAEVEAWKASGVVTGKTWLLAPDPCEFCEAASDSFSEEAVDLGSSFYDRGSGIVGKDGGEMVFDYEAIDGPPLHPNCRCSLQPKLDDEYESILKEAEAELDATLDLADARAIEALNAEDDEFDRIEEQVRRIMR